MNIFGSKSTAAKEETKRALEQVDAKSAEIERLTESLKDARDHGREARVSVAIAVRGARRLVRSLEAAGDAFESAAESAARRLTEGD